MITCFDAADELALSAIFPKLYFAPAPIASLLRANMMKAIGSELRPQANLDPDWSVTDDRFSHWFLTGRWIRVVSVGPFSPEAMILTLDQNLRVFPGQTGFIGPVDSHLDRLSLAFVGTVVLVQMLNLPFIVMKDNEVLRTCHWKPHE
jgi:hypothetical protein